MGFDVQRRCLGFREADFAEDTFEVPTSPTAGATRCFDKKRPI